MPDRPHKDFSGTNKGTKCKHLKSLTCHTVGSFYYQDSLWEIPQIYCCGNSMVTEQYFTEI